jgi:hypothetical protein
MSRAGDHSVDRARPSGAWPWAAVSIAAIALVLGGSLAAHTLIARQRQAPFIAAPAAPPMSVVAITPPGVSYELVAIDPAAGELLALTGPAQAGCPPIGACPKSAPLDTFAVLDDQTGALFARTPLAGPAQPASGAVLLLADSTHHLAYAVAPHTVTLFSTSSGGYVGDYALPADVTWSRETGVALDSAHGVLYLAGDGALLALDAQSGHLLARQSLPFAATLLDGPALDAASGRLYVLEQSTATSAATLAGFDATTLAPLGQVSLPTDTRLGPLDDSSRVLYLFGPDGATSRYPLDAAAGASPVPAPALQHAIALGWNPSLGHMYAATATGVDVRAAASGARLAALPLRVAQLLAQPLLVDPRRALLVLSGPYGALAIAHDGAPGRITPATALILARAALAAYLPDTNQDPPFVAPDTFPLSATVQPQGTPVSYYIDFSDLGWKGPYAGSASSAVAPLPGTTGGYRVTFAIAWYQLFPRGHTWTCDVAPGGSVTLHTDSGDVVP